MLSVKMNFDGPILGKIDTIYVCMTSSADFDFIGVANKYEECRSIQVRIHLNPLLVHSKVPIQSRHTCTIERPVWYWQMFTSILNFVSSMLTIC